MCYINHIESSIGKVPVENVMKQSKSNMPIKSGPQFIEFWLQVANELGTSRLIINKNAKSIRSIIHGSSDAPIYLHEAIKKSYKLSQCQNLSSPVSLESVLDILGETAYTLQGDQADDLLDIELLEEIAWVINSRYSEQIPNSVHADPVPAPSDECQVVSFPHYKIRKANSNI